MDRAHRVGQTKQVTVYRLVAYVALSLILVLWRLTFYQVVAR